VLGLVGVLGRAAGLLPQQITTPGGRVVGQLAVIAVLTLPVTLWFARWEATPRGATPGKRLLGLRVSRLDGGRLTWSDSLLRSAVKIAVPWELAHTGVWNSLAWPGPDAPINVVLFTVANGLLILNVAMVFLGAHRPPYDRLAGTIVQVDPRPGIEVSGSRASGRSGRRARRGRPGSTRPRARRPPPRRRAVPPA
jgi:uncharacterized RDD family membrane protein YckC